jgi:hypothetical protein
MKSLFAAVALLVACAGLAHAQPADVLKDYEQHLQNPDLPDPQRSPLAVPPPTKCATVPVVRLPQKAPKRSARPQVEVGPEGCAWPRA